MQQPEISIHPLIGRLPSKSDRVKTGDDNTIMGYFLLLLISGICLSILIDEKQRQKKGE